MAEDIYDDDLDEGVADPAATAVADGKGEPAKDARGEPKKSAAPKDDNLQKTSRIRARSPARKRAPEARC